MEKSKMDFKPLNSNLLVFAPEISEVTASGIVKSESMIKEEKKKQDWFLEVAAVSDEVIDIKVGDKVLMGPGSHSTIELDGVNYIIIHRLSLIGKRLS